MKLKNLTNLTSNGFPPGSIPTGEPATANPPADDPSTSVAHSQVPTTWELRPSESKPPAVVGEVNLNWLTGKQMREHGYAINAMSTGLIRLQADGSPRSRRAAREERRALAWSNTENAKRRMNWRKTARVTT